MQQRPVLVLGGGINGAAAARELALNGVSVWLVEANDLASGTTAYSSRLIHGGLRYLEFAEFSLVRESLAERGRLLRLAPHLVKPLRLFIPVRNQWGGLSQAAGKFLGLPWTGRKPSHRGLRVVQAGLWIYDRYARDGALPRRSLHRLGAPGTPRINPAITRALWAYSDAQIIYPERLVIGLLADARQLAAERDTEFRVFTYSRASLAGKTALVHPAGDDSAEPIASVDPAAIVNATGIWVDETLARLNAPSRKLMAGTKGSHFVTFNGRLRELLGGHAIYTEARDGRPVFVLPFLEGTLVGTTDIPYSGNPSRAVATDEELAYLLSAVNDLFPEAKLIPSDIAMHYCGVRPLPFVDATTPAAVTRRHQLVWNAQCSVPLVSLVGGKLTTCRSLAEETTAALLARLQKRVVANSRERPVPPTAVDRGIDLAAEVQDYPALGRMAIETEWATRLEDLIERRLMLHFSPHLTDDTLADLAAVLVETGKLAGREAVAAGDRCRERLQQHFGKHLSTRVQEQTL